MDKDRRSRSPARRAEKLGKDRRRSSPPANKRPRISAQERDARGKSGNSRRQKREENDWRRHRTRKTYANGLARTAGERNRGESPFERDEEERGSRRREKEFIHPIWSIQRQRENYSVEPRRDRSESREEEPQRESSEAPTESPEAPQHREPLEARAESPEAPRQPQEAAAESPEAPQQEKQPPKVRTLLDFWRVGRPSSPPEEGQEEEQETFLEIFEHEESNRETPLENGDPNQARNEVPQERIEDPTYGIEDPRALAVIYRLRSERNARNHELEQVRRKRDALKAEINALKKQMSTAYHWILVGLTEGRRAFGGEPVSMETAAPGPSGGEQEPAAADGGW